MANLTASCPYCEHTFRAELEVGATLACPECRKVLQPACPTCEPHGPTSCLVCPSQELFVRKDFPQRLGVGIVVTGFAASSWAWYQHQIVLTFAILFATALVDVILYLVMGNVLECYRCHAQYRGLTSLEGHEGFNLEVHERYRQQAARMKQSAAATAPPDAPADPRSSH